MIPLLEVIINLTESHNLNDDNHIPNAEQNKLSCIQPQTILDADIICDCQTPHYSTTMMFQYSKLSIVSRVCTRMLPSNSN